MARTWLEIGKLIKFIRSDECKLDEDEVRNGKAKQILLIKLEEYDLDEEEDDYHPQPISVPDIKKSLEMLYDSFIANKDKNIKNYQNKIYPEGKRPELVLDFNKAKNDPSVRKDWIVAFMAALTFRMGRVKSEATKGFIEKCDRKGWLEVFAEPEFDNRRWMDVIVEAIEDQIYDDTFSDWFYNFPIFYKVSRYLHYYVASIKEATRTRN